MASFIETGLSPSITDRKNEFERMVKELQKQLALESVYTNWIKFRVGNFALDTSDPNQQFFVSLNYTKNGSGQANSFTLAIAYEPRMSDPTGRWNLDPNIIDKQLTIYNGSQDNKLKCWLQYGYGHTPNKLISPMLEGMITDYKPEFRDGLLFYTITGYSGLVVAKEDNISVEEMEATRPTNAVKKVIEDNIGENSETNLGYKVVFGPGVENSDREVNIPEISDINIFQYISKVLEMAVPSSYNEDEETNSDIDPSLTRPYYIYEISEEKDDKTITILLVDPKNPDSKLKTSIIFNWMDKSNSLVQSWQPDVSGSVLLSQSYQQEKGVTSYGIDDAGNIVETNLLKPSISMNKQAKSNNPPTDGEKTESVESTSIDENTERNKWSKAIQYSYKATMILTGLPCDIPIGMYIEVIPLLYGKPHNTAGLYMVTKSEDQIDSGGFQTTLELIKIPTDNNYLS